ncbi:MAG: hypothetical protein ACI379_05835 [Nocardioides sp.]|uniref:hypothetical protein n=1 Tax=Nocardioides sp. TaxID=35761 RepID=UPI003F068C7C
MRPQRPAVHPAWRSEFVTTLRRRSVDPALIREHLSHLEARLGETGELPGVALGNPREYALSLGLPWHASSPRKLALAALVATAWTAWTSATWAEQEAGRGTLTLGVLLSGLAIAAGVTAAQMLAARQPRHATAWSIGALVVLLGLLLLLGSTFEQPLLSAPTWLWYVATAVAFALGLAVDAAQRLGTAEVDPATGRRLRPLWRDLLTAP